jgi:hypothetical protein
MKALLERDATAVIEFLQFSVVNHKGRVAAKDCYIANVIGVQDCVDVDKTEGTRDEFYEDQFRRVERLVLRPSAIDPELNLFRIDRMPSLLIARQDLVDKIAEAGMTGGSFTPVGEEVEIY